MRVEQFYNKNQFVLFGNGETVFQSYDSTIARIDKNGLTFGSDWDYSKTTLKHLYLFLNDYCNDKNILKALESNNKRKALQNLINLGIIAYDEGL